MSNSHPEIRSPTPSGGGRVVTREQVLRMAEAEFAEAQSSLRSAPAEDSDALTQDQAEVRRLLEQHCPEFITAASDLDALECVIALQDSPVVQTLQSAPETREIPWQTMVHYVVAHVIKRVRVALENDSTASPANVIAVQTELPASGWKISKERLRELLANVQTTPVYAFAEPSDPDAVARTTQARERFVEEFGKLFSAADEEMDFTTFMTLQKAQTQLWEETVGVTLSELSPEEALMLRTNFEVQSQEHETLVFVEYMEQRSLEIAPVTMPKQMFLEMWGDIGDKHRKRPEWQRVTTLVRNSPALGNAAAASREYKEKREQLQSRLPRELKHRECLDYIEENLRLSRLSYAKLEQEIQNASEMFDRPIFTELRSQVDGWFISAAAHPELSRMPHKQLRSLIPTNVQENSARQIVTGLAELKADERDRLEIMNQSLINELDAISDAMMGRAFTEEECLENMQVRREIVGRCREEWVNKNIPMAAVEIFSNAILNGIENMEQGIRAWFAERKVIAEPEQAEQGPARMSRKEFVAIHEKAQQENLMSPKDQERFMASRKSMPTALFFKTQCLLWEVGDFTAKTLPDHFTAEEFDNFSPQAAEMANRLYEPWEKFDGHVYRLLKEEHNRTRSQVERDVRAWFAAHAPKAPEAGPKPSSISRDALRELYKTTKAVSANDFQTQLTKQSDDTYHSRNAEQNTIREAAWKRLPKQINDFASVQAYNLEIEEAYAALLLLQHEYITDAEAERLKQACHALGERVERIIAEQYSLKNTPTDTGESVAEKPRASYSLTGTPRPGEPLIKKPTQMSCAELEEIIGDYLKVNPSPSFKLAAGATALDEYHFDEAEAQHNDAQDALHGSLPDPITDWSTLENYVARSREAYEKHMGPMDRLLRAQDAAFGRQRMYASSTDLLQSIRQKFSLPDTPADSVQPRTMSRQALGYLGREVFNTPLRIDPPMDKKDAMKSIESAFRIQQNALLEELPETFTDWQVVDDFHRQSLELCETALIAPLESLLGAFVGDVIREQTRNGLRTIERKICERFALQGAPESLPENVETSSAAEEKHEEDESEPLTNMYQPTGELPKVVTREWVLEEMKKAKQWIECKVGRKSDEQLPHDMNRFVIDVCPPIITRFDDLEVFVYWLLAKIESAGNPIVPQDVVLRSSQLFTLERPAYTSVLERIRSAIHPELPKIDQNMFDGIPPLCEYTEAKQTIPTVEFVDTTLQYFVQAIEGFLEKHKKRPYYIELTTRLAEFYMRSERALRTFCETHIGPTIERRGQVVGIHMFFAELTHDAQFWFRKLDGAGSKDDLSRSLLQRITNIYGQYVDKQLQLVAPAEKPVYPVPALLIVDQPRLASQHVETFDVQRFWTDHFYRALTRRARAFVEACLAAGISFPSENSARSAERVLGDLFSHLKTHGYEAIANACRGELLGPRMDILFGRLQEIIAEVSIPDALPEPLKEAFNRSVINPLFDLCNNGTASFVAQCRPLPQDVSPSWSKELQSLCTVQKPPEIGDSIEIQDASQPFKNAFCLGMLRNMVGVIQRQAVDGEGEPHSYAVSHREFSAAWIPMILEAVSAEVDRYLAQQPLRAPTIRSHFERHMLGARQRTLFTRACSAAEARLKTLGDRAPGEHILTAMRQGQDPVSIDVLDEDPIDIQAVIRGDLLGQRDTTLLPQEQALLEQFCRNSFDLNRTVESQIAARMPVLGLLAEECSRSYHAGFSCRSAQDFIPYITPIVERLCTERDAVPPTTDDEQNPLPAPIAQLDRLVKANHAWILAWPEQRTKRDEELSGFLQQILHWQEIATIFLRQYEMLGNETPGVAEARLAAESVALIRERGIVSITQESTGSGGRRRKASISIDEGKVRAFLDWRLERERALHTPQNVGESQPLHQDAQGPLATLTRLAHEMHMLAALTITVPSSKSGLRELQQQMEAEERQHADTQTDCTAALRELEQMSEWRETSEEASTLLLRQIVQRQVHLAQESTEVSLGMEHARQTVETARSNLAEHSADRDPDSVAQRCTALADAQARLQQLEDRGNTLQEHTTLLTEWNSKIRTFLGVESIEIPTASPDADIPWETLQAAAMEYTGHIEDWHFWNETRNDAQERQTQSAQRIEDLRGRLDLITAQRTGTTDSRLETLSGILAEVTRALRPYAPPPQQ